MNTSRILTLTLFLGVNACGGAAGTQPHDMSVPEHKAAAAQEDHQAAQHEAQYDPTASKTEVNCAAERGRVCWTATTNVTDSHAKSAEEHRDLAAKHRAASQALVDAEARACAGISEEDRDTSPFDRTADITSVSKLKAEKRVGKSIVAEDTGATIVFRATPGLTAEWLKRIVDCHLARNAAVGHDMPEMAACPLVPRDVQANVRSVGDGFAVDVSSNDPRVVAEIWRRAELVKTSK